jgi:transposase InsO family protein
MYGLEGGIRNRAVTHLAGCLPYLWRTVKYEEVYLHDYLSPREARQALTRYFTFYNHERLHQALDYQTPAEVYFRKAGANTLRTQE